MKKRMFKSVVSLLLAIAMLATMSVPAFAGTSLDLVWPAVWNEGTPPEWALNADIDTQNATIAAINNELDKQRQLDFDMGTMESFGAWGNMVIVQFSGGDNIGNPWGQAGRKMGAIVAPYPGIAFSVKGYFGQDLGSTPLSNQIEWTNPATGATQLYQVYNNGTIVYNTNGTKVGNWGYFPGSGLAANVSAVFQETYAYSAWMNEADGLQKAVNLGAAHSDAKETEDGILYQEFLGNDSTGATKESTRGLSAEYGISYIVMQDEYADEAYIVTGDMMTAWASTWDYTDAANPDRFAVTGAPIGNQYRNNAGVICQDFEECTIMLTNPDRPTMPSVMGAGSTIETFEIGDNFVYIYGDQVEVYLTDESADITALTPVFTVSESAKCDKTSGKVMDFSEPVEFTVTAENGNETVFTVTVEEASEPTAEDNEMVDAFMSTFEFIHDPVSYEDGGHIIGLSLVYDMLSIKQKYMAKDALPQIEELIAQYDSLWDNPIKIAFIGDSITDPGNPNNYATQVINDLGELGLPLEIKNFGASGYCMAAHSDLPYANHPRYQESVAFQPDYVFMLLGTNDTKPRNWDQRNVKEYFKQDMIDLIEAYQALESNPTVIVGTSPTVIDTYGVVDTINNTNMETIVEIQKEVAAEMGLPVIDINAYTKDQLTWFNSNDGVHPNTEGHTNMKQPYLDFIGDMMTTVASDITVNGETIEGFDPYIPDYYIEVEDVTDLSGIEVAATAQADSATVTVTMDEENARAKIDIKGGMEYFAFTYMVNFVEAPEFELGDVDMSGVIDVADILKAKDLIMTEEWTDAELAVGDLNDSDSMDVGDILAIKNIIMGQA